MRYTPKKYVVTSAQYGAFVNKDFLSCLENYCKRQKAELLILPMAGKTVHDEDMDESLVDKLCFEERNLNSKFKISNYSIKPQQIDPVTGLGRFTQSDVSTVFASPKQRLKVIPNSNESMPKVLMTTGAVTYPYYADSRVGKIAERDHVYGAIVVEIVNDRLYHYRQLVAGKNGHFVDLGTKYKETDTESSDLEALVLGDYHVGDTNPIVRKTTFEMITELKPKRIVLHDFFNGHSVSHHEENRLVTLAQWHEEGRLSLETELKLCYDELHAIAKVAPKKAELIVTKGNHPEFLERYLQEVRFKDDPHNITIACKLFVAFKSGSDPFRYGLELFGKLPPNIKFLSRDQDYKVYGWQLGAHGDKGANGARGGIKSKEDAYGPSITGHTHSPEIQRNTVVVGTSTHLRLIYTQGPSSWMNTHAVLWANGKVQLINIIEGKWKE